MLDFADRGSGAEGGDRAIDREVEAVEHLDLREAGSGLPTLPPT